jgi:hypothetical protein
MTERKITLGAVAHVSFTPVQADAPLGRGPAPATQWAGHYRIETIGKSAPEILAEIDRLDAHHAAKSACLNRFADLVAQPLEAGADVYTWTDCTVREHGTDVQLYLSLVRTDGTRPSSLPLKLYFNNCDAIPTNGEIALLVAKAIADDVQAAADHQSVLASVATALAGGKP